MPTLPPSKSKTILYLGRRGFPVGMAETQRQLQISKAINSESTKVLIISRKGCHSSEKIKQENIQTVGVYEGVDYIYSSGTPLYPKNFILRNFLKVVGVLGEFFIILYYKATQNVTSAIVSTSNLRMLKYFWVLTRLLNIQLVYDYVEYISSLPDRSMKVTSQEKTFDTVFFKYADSFIIISSYLEQHIKKMTSKPYIILPPTIDFEKFARIDSKPTESNYFLYCGSSQYIDVAEFIIDAYRKSDASKLGVILILIINGGRKKISKLKKSIEQDSSIKIISDLSYETLIGYYKNAKALLIPLQDNLQDKARFPFKISEYTAAARPIVTSDSGAIIDYFENGINALLAKTGDLNDYADQLNIVLNDPAKAEKIALNGHVLGQKFFNYKSYSSLLADFL